MWSKGSNRIVERAVQSAEQFMRTLKSALDERMNFRIDTKHTAITLLCKHAGYMMNRVEVPVVGKTAHERCKGKKAEVLGLEFGEKVLSKSPAGATMEKINARWGYGLFVGVGARDNELIIVTREASST